MKAKNTGKVYGNILCHGDGTPYKMIVVNGQITSEIPIKNSRLSAAKKAAKDIYGVTDLYISMMQD